MRHQRRLIREQVVRQLVLANTAARDRVFDHPWNERVEFPALTVEDLGESQDAATLGTGPARIVERRCVLLVTAELQQSEGGARDRDDLLADVEAAMAGLSIPGVKAVVPAGYEAGESTQGARPIVVGRQRFEVMYHTPMNNPEALA